MRKAISDQQYVLTSCTTTFSGIQGCNHGHIFLILNQLKLGFMAQSCLSPGFSTLLANIFSMRSNDPVS